MSKWINEGRIKSYKLFDEEKNPLDVAAELRNARK
jgi:hypothetical protein